MEDVRQKFGKLLEMKRTTGIPTAVLAKMIWSFPRILYSIFGWFLGFPTIPPLRDVFEAYLIVYIACSAFLPILTPTHSWVPFIFASVVHVLRGIRWQLTLTYISIILQLCTIFMFPNGSFIYFHRMSTVLTLLITITIPMLPPILPSLQEDVSIQDVCLKGPNGLFWIRIFYPCIKHSATNSTFSIAVLKELVCCTACMILILLSPLVIPGYSCSWHETYHILGLFLLVLVPHLLQWLSQLHVTSYLPEDHMEEVIGSIADYAKMPHFMFSHLKYWQICCSRDARVKVEREGAVPMHREGLQTVLAMHGLGGSRSVLSSTCMRLAASGYIVIAPDFGDGSASLTVLPDGSRRRYLRYPFAPGESDDSEGYFSFRHSHLMHRTGELDTVMRFLKEIIVAGVAVTSNNGTTNNHISVSSTDSVIHSVKWRTDAKSIGDDDYVSDSKANGSRFLSSLTVVGGGWCRCLAPPILLGHSFGGATALHLAAGDDVGASSFRKDWGISAVITLDPWMFPLSPHVKDKGIVNIPWLCVHTDRFQWPTNMTFETALVRRSDAVLHIRIRDAGHLNYTEMGLLSPLIQSRLMKSIGSQDPLALGKNIDELVLALITVTHGQRQGHGEENRTRDIRLTLTHAQKTNAFEVLHCTVLGD
eukprot:gene3876-7735_t